MNASRLFRPAVLTAFLAAAAPAFAEDYWDNNDWDMADAQAQLSEAIGDLPVYEISIDRYGIIVYAGDPTVNDGLRQISWREGELTNYGNNMSSVLLGFSRTEPFSFSEVDITALPAIKSAALAAFDFPGARINSIDATKPTDRASKKRVVLWDIDVKQPDREEGEVLLTALGQIVNVKLPESRLASTTTEPWIAPASVAALFTRLEKEFGDARFAEITVNDEWAIVLVEDRENPGHLAEFRIDPQETRRSGSTIEMPPGMGASLDRPFTLADIKVSSAEALADLEADTLARLELDGLKVHRYTISRSVLFMTPEDDRLVLEIRADLDDGWTGGRVTYDMSGEAVDVVTP
jgi:hypothetical protein